MTRPNSEKLGCSSSTSQLYRHDKGTLSLGEVSPNSHKRRQKISNTSLTNIHIVKMTSKDLKRPQMISNAKDLIKPHMIEPNKFV